MTWTRVTSGTPMARFTAVEICSGDWPRNFKVSRPWRNSAWGGFGRSATEARTLARTMAWRKRGTDCAVEAPGLVTMLMSLPPAACAGGAAGRAGGDGLVRAGVADGRGRGMMVATRAAGRSTGAMISFGAAGSDAGFFGQWAQAPSSGAARRRMRRALPDISCVLSCVE